MKLKWIIIVKKEERDKTSPLHTKHVIELYTSIFIGAILY